MSFNYEHADPVITRHELSEHLISSSRAELDLARAEKASITYIPAFDEPVGLDSTHELLGTVCNTFLDPLDHISFIRLTPPETLLDGDDREFFLGNLHHDTKFVGARPTLHGSVRGWISRGNHYNPSENGGLRSHKISRGVINLSTKPRILQIVDRPRRDFEMDTDSIRPGTSNVTRREVMEGEEVIAPFLKVIEIPGREDSSISMLRFSASEFLHAGATLRQNGHFLITVARWVEN